MKLFAHYAGDAGSSSTMNRSEFNRFIKEGTVVVVVWKVRNLLVLERNPSERLGSALSIFAQLTCIGWQVAPTIRFRESAFSTLSGRKKEDGIS